jgi:hypothetical protein
MQNGRINEHKKNLTSDKQYITSSSMAIPPNTLRPVKEKPTRAIPLACTYRLIKRECFSFIIVACKNSQFDTQ